MDSDRFTQYWFDLGMSNYAYRLPALGIPIDDEGLFDDDGWFDEAAGSADSFVDGFLLDTIPALPIQTGDLEDSGYVDIMLTGWSAFAPIGTEIRYIDNDGVITLEKDYPGNPILSIASDTIYFYLLNTDGTISVVDMALFPIRTMTALVPNTTVVRAFEESVYKLSGDNLCLFDTDGVCHIELTVPTTKSFAVGRAGITILKPSNVLEQWHHSPPWHHPRNIPQSMDRPTGIPHGRWQDLRICVIVITRAPAMPVLLLFAYCTTALPAASHQR